MYKVYKNNNQQWVESGRPSFVVMGPIFFDQITGMDRFDCVEIHLHGSLEHGWYCHDHVIGDMAENYSVVFFGTITECREYVQKSQEEKVSKTTDEQMKSVMRFIEGATPQQLYDIVLEIHTVHDKLMVFDEDARSLINVESVSMNGSFIQLNLEKD